MSKADHNFMSFTAADSGRKIEHLTVDPAGEGRDPAEYDDLLKLSAACGMVFRQLVIVSGGRNRENAIDLNNGAAGNWFIGAIVESGRQCPIYVKGGSCNNYFEDLLLRNSHGHSDVFLGDYSDQSFERVRGTVIGPGCRRDDGRPIRIRCGDADWPVVAEGVPYRRLYIRSYASKAYVWLKRGTRRWFGGKFQWLLP
jgi:hypothetical protein